PAEVALGADATARVSFVTSAPGVFRVRARGPLGFEAETNPLFVAAGAPPVLWGDLHGHTGDSDGTGLLEDYFRYARDVAGLDVVAVTDHDHWGIPFLDESPERWEAMVETVARFHEPRSFVALLGFEWTSWLHGHRHVLYFSERGELISSFDEATDRPEELWAALRGQPALTFAHHSAGGPVATNWEIPPDPELEPVTEVVSVHGSSEAPDSPTPIHAPIAGNFVRDVLARGYRLGFVGSGDSHDGHPGLAHLAASSGGLVALVGAERTRASVRETLRARRVYATNGPRILLQAALDGAPMGAAVPEGDRALFVRAIAIEPIERVEIVRGPEVVLAAAPDERSPREVAFEAPLEALRDGEWVYVRVLQENGGAAWSSPFFVGPASVRD
ncbi:MAG: CehA/McbA family metallohydrolase, partial [Myxococcota bacterium]